ncbi:hypothetical protein [Mesorhizobium sp. CN2-181]|uniref:hypothetical protein n=1 Tax=Mesorhizobium yinganensis TaxID=3157707 RepID=UPI0032B7C1ED
MAGLDANDRIGLRIEGSVTAEHFDRDRIRFDPAGASGQGFLDDIAEETPFAGGSVEFGAFQDTLKLGATIFNGGSELSHCGCFRLEHNTPPCVDSALAAVGAILIGNWV